jgi:hypothetical protein
MSTIAVNAITDASGGNTASINGATPTTDNTMGKNRLINGDMRIDARNAGASVTPTTDGQYGGPDRWGYWLNQPSKFSIQQSAVAPTGFSNSVLVTSLSAYALTGNDYFGIIQKIEGFNFADMMWGTANAQAITVSFWVRSSLTGTFGGAITNSAYDRSYPFSYTINVANTWEQKTVTIAGDTAGTWVGSTNGIGAVLQFSFGAVSGRLGTADAWASDWLIGSTGSASVVGTNGATFYITGVQLEAGSVATSFERVDYSEMLRRCQRYYWRWVPSVAASYLTTTNAIGTGGTYGPAKLPVTMRASPTLSTSGTASDYGLYSGSGRFICSTVPDIDTSNIATPLLVFRGSGFTIGHAGIAGSNTTNGFIAFIAEL